MSRAFLFSFLFVVAAAAGLRLWGLDAGLPHLMTRPDEEVLLLKTRLPAQGQLDLEYERAHPGVPSAYIFLLWGFGELGLPVLQALDLAPPGDYLRALDQFPARILLLERLLSALAGIGTVVAVLLVARRELGEHAGIAAGALLATCFLHVRESHSAKPDVALAFWTMVALGLLTRLAREPGLGRAILAGLAIGLGMAMKPPAVLLFAPGWVAAVWGSEGRGWRRFAPRYALILGAVALGVFVATSPDVLFNPETRRQIVNIVYIVFPALAGEAPPVEVAPAGIPDAGASPWVGYAYYFGFALRHGAGRLLLVAAPLALVWGFRSRNALAVLCATFILVGFAVFGASPARHARYLVPLLPPVAVLVAGAATALGRRIVPARATAALAAIVLVLVAEPLRASIEFDRIVSRTDTRVLTTEWLRENVPEGTVVAVAGTRFWGWGEPRMPPGLQRAFTGLDPAAIDASRARYLVTHDHPLFSSTIDPEQLARLAPRLELRAEFDPFVGPPDRAKFDVQDAYYVPLAGLDAVSRPGPVVRVYEIGPAG